MNKILEQAKKLISDSLRENLPQVSFNELEEGGMVYYMNGKNGTEFDWYVNEKLSDFMVFYDDKEKLGAAKLRLYNAGDYALYLYDDHGKNVAKEITGGIDVTEDDMRTLAVMLTNNADGKKIWDSSIEKIDTDTEPSEKEVSQFIEDAKYYENSIMLKSIMGKIAVVSKMILEDGYKVGFMSRSEPHDDKDSGWMFYAGKEDEEYSNDACNFALCYVGSVMDMDHTVTGYLNYPDGTDLIRVSADKFEKDDGQSKIYMEKWK